MLFDGKVIVFWWTVLPSNTHRQFFCRVVTTNSKLCVRLCQFIFGEFSGPKYLLKCREVDLFHIFPNSSRQLISAACFTVKNLGLDVAVSHKESRFFRPYVFDFHTWRLVRLFFKGFEWNENAIVDVFLSFYFFRKFCDINGKEREALISQLQRHPVWYSVWFP